MYQQPVNLRIPSRTTNHQIGYQNGAQIPPPPPYSNPPVSYPQHSYSNHRPPSSWNPAQQNPNNPLYQTNSAQYASQDKSYVENVYQSVPSLQQNVPLKIPSYPHNQYFPSVNTSCGGKQIPGNPSSIPQSVYSNQMFMKDQQNPIQHHQRSNISYSIDSGNINFSQNRPVHTQNVKNPQSFSKFQQGPLHNQQQSTVQGWQLQEKSFARKHYPSNQGQVTYGQQQQPLISEHGGNYSALLDASTASGPSENSYKANVGQSNQPSFVHQTEAQRTWYLLPSKDTETNSLNTPKIQNVETIPKSTFSKIPSGTPCSKNNSSQSSSATQARIKQEKNSNDSETMKENSSENIISSPSKDKTLKDKLVLSYLWDSTTNTPSSCATFESKRTESKQDVGSETISPGSYMSLSQKFSSLDEKSTDAALRDLKRLHRQDRSSSGNLEQNTFKKPKETMGHSSSDPTKSPSSKICPSPDSTILPENSCSPAAQSFLSSPHTTGVDDLVNLSPHSDSTIAYGMDELDSIEKSPPSSLKHMLGEVDESISKRRRLLGYGTECDSTNELFSESLESNNIDRLTPLKETMSCSGTGCVSFRNTNIRFCILDDKKFFVWKDFKCFYKKSKDLNEENVSSSHLCSESEAKMLSLEMEKLPTVLEGDKLYSFKVNPECFKGNFPLNCCDNSDSLVKDFDKNTTTSNGSRKDLLNTWLRTSTSSGPGTKESVNNSESAKDLYAEIEKISTMPGNVIKTFFINMLEDCFKLNEKNNQLKQQLQTQISHNKSLHEMLEKTASFLKK